MITDELIKAHPIISEQVEPRELRVVLMELERLLAAHKHGNVVEFGCYIGSTALFIQRLLTYYNSSDEYHVFDSFEGLPEKSQQDASPAGEQFKSGELLATKKQFITNFKKASLRLPVIHKGWFNQLAMSDVPREIAFAFLDGDYYESIRDSLRLIEDNLITGAVIVVDDYANEALPGAARAVDEWLLRHPGELRVEASLAIIYPR